MAGANDRQRAPGLRLHPRTMPVQRAEAELHMYLWKFQSEHDLTGAEMLRAILSHADRLALGVLREERHPGEPDRKADEA